MSKFWLAVTTLFGTVVGAGILGIPFAVSGPGVLVGFFYLLLLSAVILLLHLVFGEIVLRTKEKHRLVGYAEKYLGGKGKVIATAVDIFGVYGALLVYTILGGELLAVIFPGGAFFWSLATFSVGAIMIFLGREWISRAEFFISAAIVVVIILFFVVSLGKVSPANLTYISSDRAFIPFGVFLYALAGFAGISETREILEKDGKRYKAVITLGTLIPAALYLLFFIGVVGINGRGTSEEVFKGLQSSFGQKAIIGGAVLGFLSVVTSFFVNGLYLKNTFKYDYKMSEAASWLLVAGVPLLIFLAGVRDFITTLAFIGSVLAAVGGLLIIKIWKASKKKGDRTPEYSLRLHPLILWILGAIVVGGGMYQIMSMVY